MQKHPTTLAKKVIYWSRNKQRLLKVADRLGRGHGKYRFLDCVPPLKKASKIPDLSDWNRRSFSAVWLGHCTFRLSAEPIDEPITRLKIAAQACGIPILVEDIGDEWTIE